MNKLNVRIIDNAGVLVVLGRSVITSTEMCKIWIDVLLTVNSVAYCCIISFIFYF